VFSVGFGGVQADLEERNARFFADPAQSNDRVRLFWIGAGSNDRIIGNGGHQLSQVLKRHGIEHEFHESPGGHTWINWRRYLYAFLQRLFRDEPSSPLPPESE
jgi:enterochelin esterase-like enzyme